VGFTGTWRGGVVLTGVRLTGVTFIGGRSTDMVEVWNGMQRTLRSACSGCVSAV